MGKHKKVTDSTLDITAKKQKATRRRFILRRVAVIVVALVLVGSGAAFGYAKYLEGKMHPKGLMAKEIDKVISDPIPKEPVNFLVMGADAVEGDRGRSDSLILVHADFQNNKATMISIPRDFRVDIPGNGKDKINHSFNFGGPALTIKTVEQFTGLSINHYVVVNYEGFINIVNSLGGIDVNVKEDMVDDELGDPLDKGLQHLNGGQALFYVRFRNTAMGDFTRIADQQNFARSLINEGTRLKNTYKIPAMIQMLSNYIETDMTISEMLGYANAVRGLKQENLTTVMLPGVPDMIGGVSYVIPTQDKIDLILDAVKKNQPIDPLLLEDVDPGDVNVKVLNGSGTEGMGGEVSDILANKGYSIVLVGNADKADYAKSIIYYAKANYAKALKVKSDLKGDIPDIQLTESSTLDPSVHVIVIVGKDFK